MECERKDQPGINEKNVDRSSTENERGFFGRTWSTVVSGVTDNTFVRFFKAQFGFYKNETPESLEKYQKEYSRVISEYLENTLGKMSGSGLTKYIQSDKRAFVNVFHPDFSYLWMEEYAVNSETDDSHLSYFCSVLAKIVYEKQNNLVKYFSDFFVNESKSWEDGELKTGGIEWAERVECHSEECQTVSVVVKFKGSDIIFIIFKGTSFFSIVDWKVDFNFDFKQPFKDNPNLKVHSGFYLSLVTRGSDGLSVLDKLVKIIESKKTRNSKIVVTGHSLGGSLSSMFSIILKLRFKELSRLVHRIIGFGSGRIGNAELCKIESDKTLNFVNDLDVIPAVPEWMSPHGTIVQVTKLIPRKLQERIRSKIPVLNMSFMDHYPGEYVKNIAKLHNFPCGKKEWNAYKEQKTSEIMENSEVVKKLKLAQATIKKLRARVYELEMENMMLEEQLSHDKK